MKINKKALVLAAQFVSDPDARARVKVQMAMAGYQSISDMIDEAVIVSRELLRLRDAAEESRKEPK